MTSPWMNSGRWCLSRNWFVFLLSHQICGYRVVNNIPLASSYCLWVSSDGPSFLILVIRVFYLFLFILTTSWSILLLFSKNHLSMVSLFLISLISALIFIISFLLLFFFSRFLRWEIKCLILDLSFLIQNMHSML